MTSTGKTTYRCDAGVGTLQLIGCMDISEAGSLHEMACKAIADTAAQTICLELAQVDRLDVATLQILCALSRDLSAAGRAFQVVGMPPTIAAEVAQFGISI